MVFFPVFLSVVFVVRVQSEQVEQWLSDAAAGMAAQVSDYEFIVVDNASDDDTIRRRFRASSSH